jgi:hypothetical protein
MLDRNSGLTPVINGFRIYLTMTKIGPDISGPILVNPI